MNPIEQPAKFGQGDPSKFQEPHAEVAKAEGSVRVFETMLAFNMMVPPKVRANMAGRTLNIDDILTTLKLPVLVTHGAADRLALPAAAKYTVAKISSAKLSLYDGIGHAPFWEDTARFNAELAAFVRVANKTN